MFLSCDAIVDHYNFEFRNHAIILEYSLLLTVFTVYYFESTIYESTTSYLIIRQAATQKNQKRN